MPVQTSYPGIYIEELPSTSHTVIAAPTAVTVFVGYTNPFWPGPNPSLPQSQFNGAVSVLSFSDYQAIFGGFFSWPWLTDYVGQAVSQFFQNGGSTAYVVALQALTAIDSSSPPGATVNIEPATAILEGSPPAGGFEFTALQPVGVAGLAEPGLAMTVTVSNVTQGTTPTDPAPVPGDTADVTIAYGSAPPEIYRRLLIGDLVDTINRASRLVAVQTTGTAPTSYSGLSTTPVQFTYPFGSVPDADWTVLDPTDCAPALQPVFEANAPLDKVPIFNLMVMPGITDQTALAQALSYCEAKRAFFIMDPPANAVADTLAVGLLPPAYGGAAGAQPIYDIKSQAGFPVSPNGALYFPYLQTTDPVSGVPSQSPPSGFVAGIFAREDATRGVWKSPAGLETAISGAVGGGVVSWGAMTDQQQGQLNPIGVDCIRAFPAYGTVVFGARTLVSPNTAFQQWWYVAVRRMALFIEDSLYDSLGWAVFEPNDTPLWQALTQEVQAFMLGLYRQGAFQGATASQAFNVQCDGTTTTQADIDNGVVNILVGFAPLKPAEFVVVQIQQLAGQTQS